MSNDAAGSKDDGTENPELNKETGAEDTTTTAADATAATDDKAAQDQAADDKTIDLGKSWAETDPAADTEVTAKVTAPAADNAPDAAAAKADSAKRSFGPVTVLAAFVAGILLVAAVTAVVVFYLRAQDRGDKLDAQADASKAACEYGRLISTYSPETIDDYLTKVDGASTGEWKDTFSKLGQDLKGVVVDAKATSSTYDMQCGFQSGDAEHATVLVVIGQTTSNVNTAAANKPPSHVELVVVAGLEKDGDKWLVNKFDLPILKQMGNN
ncbi:hypothetical protein [Nocardia australiensis]|uniref:hypothetical protein n=1 Tax=Nocardia australiensis TaxID=2887191 RepID=UPI001D137204|nr:hypothetical protein [Nocardia australiensis]